ncbi:MAG: aerobic carbon-monoxide dehydrogenase large subunit [Solirubrobacteraceae bacterium]
MTIAPAATGSWIGASIRRHEDPRLVTGTGLFADDELPAGALHCAILRSPHPHARIVSIDTSRARAIPGVVVVITGREALEYWTAVGQTFVVEGMRIPAVYGLAVDKAVFEGEPIAAVAATNRYLAEDALEAIDVEYDVLEPVMNAVAPDDPGSGAPIYDTWPDNVQLAFSVKHGDPEGAFAEADLVVSERVSVHRYSAVPLEGRAVVADFDPQARRLTVRASTQVPHQSRTQYARIFGLPESSVTVYAHDVGGGFGSKLTTEGDSIPVLLAIVAGRPVKWAETREEWLLSAPTGSRDYVHDGELAVRTDGTILGLRDRLICDFGCDAAVRTSGSAALLVGGVYAPGPYRIEHYDFDGLGMVTNKAPYGAYRGYGKDVANQLIERLLDRAAAELDMDPVEIRRRNLVTEFPHQLCTGPIIENGSFVECLYMVEREMDVDALHAEQAAALQQGRYVGVGIVSVLEPSGGAFPMSLFTGIETASVRLHADGTATALTGMQPLGQGVQTTYAQVVADAVGITPGDVEVIWGDTKTIPHGQGSWASRGATYGASAAHEAGLEVRRKLLIVAGNLLDVEPGALEAANGEVWIADEPERRLSVAAVADAAYFMPGPYAVLPDEPIPMLEATAVATNPEVSWTPDELGRVRLYPTHASAAYGCLVEVDVETGQVDVRRIWAVHDAGRIINPAIVDAQIRGSSIQAFGGTMFEQVAYAPDGRLLTRTLTDYQLPNHASVPDIDVFHVETPSPITPLGTKGVGEGGHIGIGAVLVAAVEDALRPLGVKVLSTPLTPSRVRAMIAGAAQ